MPLVPHAARSAYLRLTSVLAPAPLGILAILIVLTAAAWAITLYQSIGMSAHWAVPMHDDMAAGAMNAMTMGDMPAQGWSVAGLMLFVTVWTVMMAAMMLPAAMPMILIFASAQARRTGDAAVPTWVFVAGYFLVWAGAGVLVHVLGQVGNDVVSHLAWLDRTVWAPLALGVTLTLAGLYQFTPLKRVCLRHCRSPFGFVAQYWREGRVGALGMGFRHGLYCLGCCWALFAVLLAAGMMSLAWMLLLTLVIFAEKVLPHGPRTATAVGAVFIALGVIVAGAGVSTLWHA